ncbi:MAG: vitamin K epoxide reductase family protein [Ktedonobacteraceae bacterium]
MSTIQRSLGQWLLLALSIIGAGIAIYLTTVHYEHVPLLCSSQGIINCERVTSSAYSVVPGTTIPITLPGLAWFVVMAALAITSLRSALRWIKMAALVWTILGMLTVLYLVYAEIVQLHTICLWCTGVHIIIFASFIIALIEVYRSGQDEEVEEEEEQSPLPARR